LRPSWWARIIGKATSSICRPVHTGVPSGLEFCGNDPSGFCWTSNSQSSARLAPAVSPAAISPVAIWYRSRDHTRWYGPDGTSVPQTHGIDGDAT
jgi:hypothetical protein